MDLHTFLAVLRRHRALIALTVVGTVAAAVVFASLRPERYAAESTLRLRTAAVAPAGTDAVEFADRLQDTYAELVDTESFQSALAVTLGTDDPPDVSLRSSGNELLVLRAVAEDGAEAIAAADEAAALLQRTVQAQVEAELAAARARVEEVGDAAQPVVDELEAELRALTVVEPAGPEVESDAPGLVPIAALGAVAGVIAGVGLALVRDNLRDESRSGAEAASLLGAPLLGGLPTGRRASAPDDAAALEGAALRLAEREGDVWLVLGDHRTTAGRTGTALASAMSRFGVDAVVVDVDGGTGRGDDAGADLADVLAGRANATAAGGAGGAARIRMPRNGGDRLTPAAVAKGMVRLHEQFDLVVVEAARGADASGWLVLSSVIPFVVVVLDGPHVSRASLRRLREDIEAVGASVVGVVLAGADVRGSGGTR